MTRYYLDTCIWRDYFENRIDNFRPLGEWAFKLIKKIIAEGGEILYSDLVIEELEIAYSDERIQKIFSIVPREMLIKVTIFSEDLKYARELAKQINLPYKDALHSILSKNNNSLFITRDKHFENAFLNLEIFKPEDLI